MTRLDLFKSLCDITDALEARNCALADPDVGEITARMDILIDRCVREGVEPLHAGDTSPCPACGQDACTHWQVLRETQTAQEGL